jgi:hypothetical protein
MTQSNLPHQPVNPVAMWTALVLALVVTVGSPTVVWAQGAGCAGTAIQFTSLDNLLRTASSGRPGSTSPAGRSSGSWPRRSSSRVSRE